MADAPGQARRTVDQGAEYVTILMGANDLCGWDGALTPTSTFRAQFRETLEILRDGLPGGHVFVASIPNLTSSGASCAPTRWPRSSGRRPTSARRCWTSPTRRPTAGP
jgi:lysophospholipase L1-like esterase